MSEKPQRLRKGTPDDWPSLALLEFTMALSKAMADNHMKQKDLAEALDVSPPYISSVMSGNENLTVEQMSRLAEAAGGSLHLTVAPQGLYIKWVEDTLEGATTTEAELGPPPHSHEVVMPYPLPAPLLEVTRHNVPSRNASRSVHPFPLNVGARKPGVPQRRRQPIGPLDPSGRLFQ